MDHLWAPWRMAYISPDSERDRLTGDPAEPEGCLFCHKVRDDPARDAENLILFRGKRCFVMMNLFPYNSGHLMVAPNEHVASLEWLPEKTATDVMLVARRCQAALRAALHPDGFNLGINEGAIAGAGFPGHVHLHIVPRWSGDTNFMPVIAAVKVMPELLQQTYEKIRAHWPQGKGVPLDTGRSVRTS
jgi:ATP adenylyltransferase